MINETKYRSKESLIEKLTPDQILSVSHEKGNLKPVYLIVCFLYDFLLTNGLWYLLYLQMMKYLIKMSIQPVSAIILICNSYVLPFIHFHFLTPGSTDLFFYDLSIIRFRSENHPSGHHFFIYSDIPNRQYSEVTGWYGILQNEIKPVSPHSEMLSTRVHFSTFQVYYNLF